MANQRIFLVNWLKTLHKIKFNSFLRLFAYKGCDLAFSVLHVFNYFSSVYRFTTSLAVIWLKFLHNNNKMIY